MRHHAVSEPGGVHTIVMEAASLMPMSAKTGFVMGRSAISEMRLAKPDKPPLQAARRARHHPQKVAQCKRIGGPPRNRALRVQSFEIADQQQPKIAPGRQPRRPSSA